MKFVTFIDAEFVCTTLKARHQVLLLNPEKKFGANPSCVFEETAKAA